MKKILYILIVFNSIFAQATWLNPGLLQDTKLLSNLAARWRFDSGAGTSALDSSGNNLTGTFTNGPTWVTGQIGSYAANFDGTNDYISVGTPAALANLGPLTFSAWINPSSAGGGGLGKIIVKSSGVAANAFQFYLCSGINCATTVQTRVICFQKINGSGSGAYASRCSADNSITWNVWQHVAVTWDGSIGWTNLKLYINGAEVASYTNSGSTAGAPTSDAALAVFIGNRADTTRAFAGAIDDLRIFNRVLTAAEIASIYKGTP